jgi:hypothetical protein
MNAIPTTNPRNPTFRFSLGDVAMTPGVRDLLAQVTDPWPRATVNRMLARHASGDWGEVPPEDAAENELALQEGYRLMSVYYVCGERVWVITEADRSCTTLLLPDEY